MKISYNWLKEYVDINIKPEKLAELLTAHSFEIEDVKNLKYGGFENDAVFEADILPNRAHDCLCHFGVAREISVITKSKIKNQKPKLKIKTSSKHKSLEVYIENNKLCRRYSAAVVRNVRIKESPFWLKRRLKACGIEPINNIVDITNYVMLAVGQPMHAFDEEMLNGKIFVRNAKRGEKITALDRNKYDLNVDDLIISDENNPIAIAGIIGGLETSVGDKTASIVFESANFSGINIRKTSKRLKLSSESSYRFEREIDPELTTKALKIAVEMAENLSGGKIEGEILDIYLEKAKRTEIMFDKDRIKNLLGIEIDIKKAIEILKTLGFETSIKSNKIIKTKVPTYRIDVVDVNDVIEEIGRIYGYENIPEISPFADIKAVSGKKILLLEKEMKNILEGLGWNEVYNYSFISEKDIRNVGLSVSDHIELENPLSEEVRFLRTRLISGLLKNTANNLKYKQNFKLFEAGKTHIKNEKGKLTNEKRILAGIIAKTGKQKTEMFYELKGQIEVFLKKLGICDCLKYKKIEEKSAFWHKGKSANVLSDDKTIVKFGEIHPSVLENFGIDMNSSVLYFEIKEDNILKFYGNKRKYKRIEKFPFVELDMSFIFNEDAKWEDIKNIVFNTGGKIIRAVNPFDIYRGRELGANKKSIAFRTKYQSIKKTLKNEEVLEIQNKIIKALEKFGGKLRRN